MRPIFRDVETEFVPDSDRELPPGEQSAIIVTPFSHADQIQIMAKLGEDFDPTKPIADKRMLDIVYHGARSRIVGFRNLYGKDGEPLPCERSEDKVAWGGRQEMLTEECASPLSLGTLTEVFAFCLNDCQLSEDDRKKSQSPVS